jgi:hypothetical protein
MKPKWIDEVGASPPTGVDSTVIARWWPGRYYRVSTIWINPDGDSPTKNILGATLPEFVTQVFACDRTGLRIDTNRPLYEVASATKDEALQQHRVAVLLFSIASFAEVERFAKQVRSIANMCPNLFPK